MEKKRLQVCLILMLCWCFFSGCSKEVPINERPMYGGKPPTIEEQKAHEEFIKVSIENMGSREAACEYTLGIVKHYIDKGDLRTAMKRTNQAWLLDPKNPNVFIRFGDIMRNRGDKDKAIKFYKKALELDPTNAILMCNLGRQYYSKAYRVHGTSKLDVKQGYLNEAINLYKQASQTAKDNADLGYIYYQWACALLLQENYTESWKKVKLSRKHSGNEFLEARMIQELSRYMPEP